MAYNFLRKTWEEKLTPDGALLRAQQTGSNVFEGGVESSREWKTRWDRH